MAGEPQSPVIEFHYDISCPFAYIASTRIEDLARRTGAKLIWRPVLLGAIYRATKAPQGAAGSASDVFNATKKAVTAAAFRRTIQRCAIAYQEPPRHPVKTTVALRLLYFVNEQQRPRLSKALFRAYWVDGKDVSRDIVLFDVIRHSGIEGVDAILDAFTRGQTQGPEQRRQLETATDLAVKRGAPGVPSFWIPDSVWTDSSGAERKGRLFWGQDRMHFVEAAVLAMKNGYSIDQLDKSATPLRALLPRRAHRDEIPPGEDVKLEFWYDFSSPWAFLGWTQLASLQRRYGERLKIVMKPFLLGILFRQIGAPNLPMAALSKQKRDYNSLDHTDWVRWWNAINIQEGQPDKNIDFKWASNFPIRTPTLLRAAIVKPELTSILFRACWERNIDMSNDENLKRVIEEFGLNAEEVLRQANDPKIKADLRKRTQDAKEVGICGVPSYRVFHREKREDRPWTQVGGIVWGQDETAVVEDLISGWGREKPATTREQMTRL